jgi:hypothetical protein
MGSPRPKDAVLLKAESLPRPNEYAVLMKIEKVSSRKTRARIANLLHMELRVSL